MKQEDINLLKQLGLTTYEAKAYITLSSLIQATADEISEKSDIPRSKIYDVLKRLNSKDYIKIESGRPLTYHVNPPINVLKREKEKFIRRINKTGENLNIPYVKLLISDSKEMMHIYSKFSKENGEILPNTAIGIWNQYEEIANNYNERFENQLKKIANNNVKQ